MQRQTFQIDNFPQDSHFDALLKSIKFVTFDGHLALARIETLEHLSVCATSNFVPFCT
jgi:hypothetical protein